MENVSLCTFFGHFLTNPPKKVCPGGTPAQRASIALQCCSPIGPPSLWDGFLRGGGYKTDRNGFPLLLILLGLMQHLTCRLQSPVIALSTYISYFLVPAENENIVHRKMAAELWEKYRTD